MGLTNQMQNADPFSVRAPLAFRQLRLKRHCTSNAMPPKTKRTVKEREDGTEPDLSLPTKRLRTEDTHSAITAGQNGAASPQQIEEPVDLDEEEEEIAEVAPTPILGDLYLETVVATL
jgi:hypothetical protein